MGQAATSEVGTAGHMKDTPERKRNRLLPFHCYLGNFYDIQELGFGWKII